MVSAQAKPKARIALDAMGGDHAPDEIVAGALRALDEGYVTADELVLVGDARVLPREPWEVLHASEVIAMDDHAGRSIRTKRDSSIVVGSEALRDGRVAALVSAGNTGAVVAAGTLIVGRLPGVRRPGIAASFPSDGGSVTVIDVGANVHCLPEDLLAYGYMAAEYRAGVDGIERPRVGLLSIGEEDVKGNDLVHQARELLRRSALHFVGNVEGQDVFSGAVDVVVCEGFVGNVVLKVSEGLGQFLSTMLEREVRRHTEEGSDPSWEAVGRVLRERTDYAEYGGALLLGIDGLVLIGHGRSDRRAIANALRAAKRYLAAGVQDRILSRIPRSDASRTSGGGS